MTSLKRLEKRITRGYMGGLLLVAFLSCISTYILYHVIDSEEGASQIYSRISAQQNRIQRIALLTVSLTEVSSGTIVEDLRNKLQQQTDELMQDHNFLIQELFEIRNFKWKTENSMSLATLDAETYSGLDRGIRTYAASARYLGQLESMPTNKNSISVKVILDKANSEITSMLSDLHTKYRKNHEQKQWLYKKIQIGSLAAILVVLVMEGIFLFRPMVRFVKREHKEITDAKTRADHANKVKTQFLANVSHEIRTPLTAIIGFTEMISMDSSLSNTVGEKNETIKRSALYLKSLIDDLLEFTKAEESHIDVHEQPFSIDQIIHEVVSVLSVKAKEKNLDFGVVYSTPIPETVHSDPIRIKQILFNIVGNAIKFTDSGVVTIDASFEGKNSELRIIVRDTGRGIAADHQQVIFSRFMQADDTMTRKESGSGIGLALSKILCEALGGSLSLVETSIRGTSFKIVIRVTKADCDQKIESFETLKQSNSNQLTREHISGLLKDVRILLVEDGKENQRIYTYFLEMAGAFVTAAWDGAAGVDAASRARFDIILMDIQMPRMDGYEAVRVLRSSGTTQPIIALTAHALKSEREKCLEIGFSDYLAKPVAVPTLLKKVAGWTRKSNFGTLTTHEVLKNLGEDAPNRPYAPIHSLYHGHAVYMPLIEEFCENLPNRINELKTAMLNLDWTELAKTSHKISGAASSFGFPLLSHLAGVIETEAILSTEARTADVSDFSVHIHEMDELCQRICLGMTHNPKPPPD